MPRSADMEQVKELLSIIQGVKTKGGLVALSFIARRVQPCKERAHPLNLREKPMIPERGRRCYREMLWRSEL